MMYCITHQLIEINGFLFEPGVYCGVTLLSPMADIAETIWCEEDNGEQWYLVPDENGPNKRRRDFTQPFDLKEFLWVKLTAKNWSEISGIEEVEIGES